MSRTSLEWRQPNRSSGSDDGHAFELQQGKAMHMSTAALCATPISSTSKRIPHPSRAHSHSPFASPVSHRQVPCFSVIIVCSGPLHSLYQSRTKTLYDHTCAACGSCDSLPGISDWQRGLGKSKRSLSTCFLLSLAAAAAIAYTFESILHHHQCSPISLIPSPARSRKLSQAIEERTGLRDNG